MKRSRTRRIVSLFMVLTGILLVFSGFVQDARRPAVLAANDYPCGTWNCTAQDVTDVLEPWLVDLAGQPLVPCQQGTTVQSAKIRITADNNTKTNRYCTRARFILATFDLEGNPLPETQVDEFVTRVPAAGDPQPPTGLMIPGSWDYEIDHAFSWTCGEAVELRGFVLSWETSPSDCTHWDSWPDETVPCSPRKAQCWKTDTLYVPVPLSVGFTWENVCDGAAVAFESQVSGGVPPYNTYAWSFGGAGVRKDIPSDDVNPKYLYDGPGTYNVSLTVTDDEGSAATANGSVTVYANPVASFSFSPGVLKADFTDTSTAGSGTINSWSWSFGDGGTSTVQNPTHEYAQAGKYTVKLTVADSNGCSDSYETDVTVPEKLIVDVTWPAGQCYDQGGNSFAFEATPSDGVPPYTYSWTFGDGGTSTAQNPTHTYYGAGTYNVSLTVKDSDVPQNSVTYTGQATVWANPSASAFSNSPVCVGETLTLSGGPQGMESYWWTGPGGFTSDKQSPTVSSSAIQAMAGIYTLTVIDSNGCTDDETTTVVVNDNPVATAANDGPVCVGETLTLTGGPDGMKSYSWSGPNTFSSSDQSPTVSSSATQAMAGTYILTVTDFNGCTDQAQTTVVVNPSPVASFTAAPVSGEPLKVQFTDTSTPGSPNGGLIVGWSWDFGDGSATSIEQNPTHTYAAGTYTVILTVTDANGCTDSTDLDIAVSAKMMITIDSTDDPCDGNEICFFGWADLAGQGPVSLSALEGYTFLWDFGDPDTSDDWSDKDDPCYTYSGPGTYNVTLTVTHEDTEVSGTAKTQVTVYANPTASFTAVPASGVAPLTVQFTDNTSGGTPPYTYAWDFGEGDPSSLKDPTHVYLSAGAYTVVLMVTDAHGCTDSHARAVTVTPRPELSIDKTADKYTANIDDVIDYTITVENTGDLALTDVVVNDAELGIIDLNIGNLGPGDTHEITRSYGPVTEDDLPGPIHNVATATSNETPDPVEDEWDVTLVSGPAIQVVKTANKDEAMVGEPIKYTYVVTNLGDVTLTDVTVTDDMLGSITLEETTLATGASTSGELTYFVAEGDLPVGPLPVTLVNVATASGTPPVGTPVTDDDDASVLVVEPYAPPALLSIEKTGDAGPVSVGDTIKYTIKVTNSGDAALTNVVVNDTKLGIIDRNIGDLDPGETYEITASYGPLEDSDVGYVDNTASAQSDQAEPVEDSWRVLVVEPEQPVETPTPTPIPCIRSDIDVIVYGKIPVHVDMYVAGDLDHSKQTAVNAFGEQQATFSVWPGAGETYVVSITPRLPGYLDPAEWTFQLIKGSLSMRIPRCVHREVILQLLHSGPSVTPTPAPTLPVEELPVTGVQLPASSFGGRLLKLLGFLLIGSGGVFYWTSRRD